MFYAKEVTCFSDVLAPVVQRTDNFIRSTFYSLDRVIRSFNNRDLKINFGSSLSFEGNFACNKFSSAQTV